MYDAIVVGARCAGATTAMLLARQGHRVLLVDRASFPSEVPRGHFIHRHGPARLAKWGLLDRIEAAGCPLITTMAMDLGDFPLTGRDLGNDGVPLGLGPRRGILDKVLVEAAVEAGAELREGFAVDRFSSDGDRVTGIVGRDRGHAREISERARLTIGADGRNSRLASHVGAVAHEAVPSLSCWYFSYWSGVAGTGLEMYVKEERAIFAFPTTDDLFAVFVGWPIAELPAVRADIEGELWTVLDRVPDLAERVRAGTREERFLGASDLPNFVRTAGGPGWALVGDAGCHKDPLMALGVCDALRDAETLADGAGEALRDGDLDPTTVEYDRRHHEATLPDYQRNLAAATLQPPPPEMLAIRAAVRGDQEETNALFRAMQGGGPAEPFFSPDNVARLMSRDAAGSR